MNVNNQFTQIYQIRASVSSGVNPAPGVAQGEFIYRFNASGEAEGHSVIGRIENGNITGPGHGDLTPARPGSYTVDSEGYVTSEINIQEAFNFWNANGYKFFTILGLFTPLSQNPMYGNSNSAQGSTPKARDLQGTSTVSEQRRSSVGVLRPVGLADGQDRVRTTTEIPQFTNQAGQQRSAPNEGVIALRNIADFGAQGFTLNNTLKIELTTNDPAMPRMTIPEFDETSPSNPDVVWCLTAESYLSGVYIMSKINFTNVTFNVFMTRSSAV